MTSTVSSLCNEYTFLIMIIGIVILKKISFSIYIKYEADGQMRGTILLP